MAQAGSLAAGVLFIWLIYYLLYGVTFFEVYSQGLISHLKITGYRTYTTWLGYNLFDFFLFLGIPLVLAFGLMVVRQVKAIRRDRLLGLTTIPFWSFLLTILALNLSGVSKGEVARLWMFLVPLAILAVLPVVKGWKGKQMAVVIFVLIAQALLIGYFVRTIGSTNYPYYEPRKVQRELAAGAEPLQVTFGAEEALALQGYSLQRDDGDSGRLDLVLYWQTDRPLQHSYTVFVHLVEPTSGQVIAQDDSLPQQGRLPTLCWQDGEVVADGHTLTPGPNLQGGNYQIHVGLYRLDLLQAGDPNHRLVIQPDGQQTSAIIAEFEMDG